MIKIKETAKKVKEHVVRNRGTYGLIAGVALGSFMEECLRNYREKLENPSNG